MTRTGVFASKEAIQRVKDALGSPVMYLPGGTPMFETAQQVAHREAIKAGLPEIRGYYGIDLSNGEFLST